jgi:hypothetical protein
MARTLFSVVLLFRIPLTLLQTGSFVEPNILLGAASACQKLYYRFWRKAAIRRNDILSLKRDE